MGFRKLAVSLTPVAGLLLVPGLPSAAVAAEGGQRCEVTVDRNYSADTFYVTRQDLANGDCVCYVQTGPNPQSADIEGKITALRTARECATPDNVMAVPAGYTAAATGTGGAVGTFSLAPALAAVGVAAAGIVVAMDDDDNPASP